MAPDLACSNGLREPGRGTPSPALHDPFPSTSSLPFRTWLVTETPSAPVALPDQSTAMICTRTERTADSGRNGVEVLGQLDVETSD